MNLENTNSNINPAAMPGSSDSGISLSQGLGDGPIAPISTPSDLDGLINESVFETRHRDATREIQKLNEVNRLTQDQLRDMADNYKVAKTELEDVNGRLGRIRQAMRASVDAGEVLPASDRLAFEQAEQNWISKKADLENKIVGMGRKMEGHQQAEADLSVGFIERVKADTLDAARRFAPLLDGNKATMYQIIKNEIVPNIDQKQPHLVEKYRRGEMTLEQLILPHMKESINFYKQLYGSRDGGNVGGSGSIPAAAPKAPQKTFTGFAGLL